MATSSLDDDAATGGEASASPRAAPNRLNAKKKPVHARKRPRKTGNAAGGIHLRANKRANW